MRRATSHLATLDIRRLVKAQWSTIEARVKVSVTWHCGGKHVIFVRLQDFLSQLLTEDTATQIFILQVKEGKVVIWHCKSLSGGEECDHVNEEQEANDKENEHVTTEGSESNEEQADGDGEWNTKATDEEYFSFEEEENKSLSDEEYVTDEADEEHSNSDEEYFSFEEEEAILPALEDDDQGHPAIPDRQEGATATPDQKEDKSVKWSKLRIHSKRPTNPTHHRAVQEDAIEERVEEETVLSLTLPQEPHVEAVAKEGNKKQEKRKPCRAKADVGLIFGVMHVHGHGHVTPPQRAGPWPAPRRSDHRSRKPCHL